MRNVVSGQMAPAKLNKVSLSPRKAFRSYRTSKNELEISQGGYNLSLGEPPGDGNLKLANAPTSPCHHHIDAAYDCSVYYQLSNLFCLCPSQQATT